MKDIFSVFKDSLKNHYIIGAFNFYNLETLQAILNAGEECKTPIICAASESALDYMGIDTAVLMFQSLIKNKKYPAFLHLDHGKTFEVCKKVIDAGFDSVMIDASSLPFKENVELTKKVVKYASKNGVFVEAELGSLAGVEDGVKGKDIRFTDPEEANYFIQMTGINSLAVAIGTSHGAYKFKGNPKLRLDILTEIENRIGKFPLVLHGASSIDPKLIKNINKFGGGIENASGVAIKDLKEIKKSHNVCKINVDTDLRLAFISAVREGLYTKSTEINPRNFLNKAKNEMVNIIKDKINNIFKN
ncbi:MAG: class II fructose-bisphosphate aldolase [Clostridia bacterium]|nr:class II fructose-bisphosphate aldolase [Clostridia bacterium]